MEPFSAALLAKPVGALAAKLLRPIYDRLDKELGAQVHLAVHRVFNSYTNYLQQSLDRHSYFVSVVFKNEQRKLVDYYQPLTLLETRSRREIKIDRFPAEEVERTKRLLVVDTAGMGKTTILKYLFLQCVDSNYAVPILVELRKLSRKTSLVDHILQLLSDLDGSCKSELFFKLVSKGGFCFFLDGYDEIPESERSHVTTSIQQLVEKASNNSFLMTSRDEGGLSAFPQFQRYTINPLQKEEAYSLLRKYADAPLAESLITRLELPENRAIQEFLTNPLLTSLLFKSFEYKQIIPLKRHIFYRQVYESLYESHDLTKEGGAFQRVKKSGLEIDRFENVLRALGAVTYKGGKTELSKEAALEFSSTALKLCSDRKTSPSSIVHDVTHAVPLMVADGNYIRWSHRSIQEYFAAQYLCKNTQGRHMEVLREYYLGPDFIKHQNLVLLCADIDKAAFDRSIGRQIADDLLAEYRMSYRGSYPGVPESAIEERRIACAGKVLFLVNCDPPNDDDGTSARVHSLHRFIVDNAGETGVSGSSITYGTPGVGHAKTKLLRFLVDARARIDLPYITTLPRSILAPSKLGWPDEEILKLTDDPSNPLNSQELFSATTRLISSTLGWRFDPERANQYLLEVESDSRTQVDSRPW